MERSRQEQEISKDLHEQSRLLRKNCVYGLRRRKQSPRKEPSPPVLRTRRNRNAAEQTGI